MSSDEEDGDFRDDGNEEEEEDGSSSEGDENPRPSKRQKTAKGSSRPKGIFDLEASASSEEESDDEGSYDEADAEFLRDDPGDDDLSEDRTSYIRLNNRVRATNEAERIAQDIEERHRQYVGEDFDEEDFERGGIHQQVHQPTYNDPKLWSVKTKTGHERQIVCALMMKYLTKKMEGNPPPIYSVVSMDHLKGYIYVEAYKEQDVRDVFLDFFVKSPSHRQFVVYINGVFSSKIAAVKLNDMVAVLTVPKRVISLKKGDWVRIKLGTYKGDLAQVYEYDTANETAWVRLVPRLDLASYVRKVARREEDGGSKRGREKKREGPRPPQKHFSPEEVTAVVGENQIEHVRDLQSSSRTLFMKFDNQMFKDGFLHKKVRLRSLIIDGIVPTLEELQTFQIPDREDDEFEDDPALVAEKRALKTARLLAATQKKKRVVYEKGEAVEVVEGKLTSLKGIIHDIDQDGDTLHIKTDEASLGILPVSRLSVRKLFRVGDHVKVLEGQKKDETGMIIQISNNIAVVLSDVARSEIKVQTSDLQKTNEIFTGLKYGDFSHLDMIQLNANEVGVIINIEGDTAEVIDVNNLVKTRKLQGVMRKKDSRNAVGRDHDGSPVGPGDKIRVLSGEFADKAGNILHIYRLSCFVECTDLSKNRVRTKQTQLVGSSANQRVHGNKNQVFGAKPQYGGSRGGRGKRNNPNLNKTVLITFGPHKGYYGTVKDATDSVATVELQSNGRRVQFPLASMLVLDDSDRQGSAGVTDYDEDMYSRTSAGSATPRRSDATPAHQIPDHNDMDPFNTSILPSTPFNPQTPRYEDAAEPGVYDPNTPYAYSSSNAPVSTPYTPVPQHVAQTPYTPSVAHMPYAQTPGTPSMNYSAQTPGTPGVNYSAPTPRTPGMAAYPTAPTPRTPGFGNVGTPALGGYGSAGGSMYQAVTPYETPYNPPQSMPVPQTPMVPMTPAPTEEISNPYIPNMLLRSKDGGMFVVNSTSGNECTLEQVNNTPPHTRLGRYVTLHESELSPILPQKSDQAIVISAEHRHRRCIFLNVDSEEGIVQFAGGDDVAFVPLKYLTKYWVG